MQIMHFDYHVLPRFPKTLGSPPFRRMTAGQVDGPVRNEHEAVRRWSERYRRDTQSGESSWNRLHTARLARLLDGLDAGFRQVEERDVDGHRFSSSMGKHIAIHERARRSSTEPR